MRKLFGVSLVIVLVLALAAVALAAPPPWQRGQGIFAIPAGAGLSPGNVATFVKDSQYVNVNGFNRTVKEQNLDGNQQTIVRLKAIAYIPCYLEMEVIGNEARYFLQSFGPGAVVERGPEATHSLIFASEVGGFVDASWFYLGSGSNLQVSPLAPTPYYLQGCDIFSVKIWSNDTWEYQVIASPLTNAGGQLPMDMRSASAANVHDWYLNHSFTAPNTVASIGGGAALTGKTWYHQFRVPYNDQVAAGIYDGEVVFKAVTI